MGNFQRKGRTVQFQFVQ